MKRSILFSVVLCLFAAPLIAAGGTQILTLGQSVQVGTNHIQAGKYKVTWAGNGEIVQVTLEQGKNKFTFPARLVETKGEKDGYSSDSAGGVERLKAIQFRNVTLNVDDTPPKAGN
jgi:hypothetical protein